MPLLAKTQWIMRRIIPNSVAVLLTDGVETGVEIRLGLRGRRHPDIFRQVRIGRQNQFVRGHPPFGSGHIEMHRHPPGMNSGIGATGTDNPGTTTKQPAQGDL